MELDFIVIIFWDGLGFKTWNMEWIRISNSINDPLNSASQSWILSIVEKSGHW